MVFFSANTKSLLFWMLCRLALTLWYFRSKFMALWMSYSCFMAYLFLPFIISKVILSVRLDRESVSKSKSKSKKNIYSGHKRVAIWHLAAFEKRFFFLLKCAWQQRRASWQGHIQKSKKQKQNVYFFCLVETKAKNLIQSRSSWKKL